MLTGFSSRTSAQTISWFSAPQAVNLMSNGTSLMDGGFHFELGVFKDGFVPTSANTAQWSTHWQKADRCSYQASTKSFGSDYENLDNEAPFTSGATAYVWGFRGGESSGEWILFRHTSWNWPQLEPPGPPGFPLQWSSTSANTVILGSMHASGSPWLMKSAAVTNSAPPPTSWPQWQSEELAGTLLNGPNDDPDGDGISNLIEFVFGTAPKTANPPVATPSSILDLGGQRYLQVSIPRRRDHPATLVVEVSSDLATWNSGTTFTQVVLDGAAALVVRDLTPIGPGSPKRFMRARAIPPTP